MVSSVTSHEEKDCHLQYSRSQVASFSQAMNMKKRSLHLLRYLFSCSITLQGTLFFLMFNLPCSNPWPWPLAIMPVATTTWIWFCHLYGFSLCSCTKLLLDPLSFSLRAWQVPLCQGHLWTQGMPPPPFDVQTHSAMQRKGSTGGVSRDILHGGLSPGMGGSTRSATQF